jgi:putative transposase
LTINKKGVSFQVLKPRERDASMENLQLVRAIWKKFQPMIATTWDPAARAKKGRPKADERRAFFGICYMAWSGCSWRALPSKFGKRSTVHRYFQKWADSGLFQRLWHTVLVFLNQEARLKNDVRSVDGSLVTVQHLSKCVAFISMKLRPKRVIKFSVLVDAQGVPLATLLGSANKHDTNLLEATVNQEVIKTLNYRGRLLLGDKGYVEPRQELTALLNEYAPIFCPRKYHADKISAKDRKILKSRRWIVERSISWIKSFRRIKICYERSLQSFQSFLDLACLMITFKKAYL